MLTLRFDGLFRGVPGSAHSTTKAGFMSYGWLIFDDDLLIARGHGVCARGRDATSNVAEYLALIEGMEALLDLGIRHDKIRICGDAKCVIDQMNGDAECNSPRMRPVYQRARRLAQRLVGSLASHQDLQWSWAPRSFNKEADSLTRRAMAQFRLDADGYQAAMRAIDPRYGDGKITNKFLTLLDLRVYHPGGMTLS